ncbi:bifunctional tetrahydrofolate synthase/dihydrofolate synthase [Bacillaceae bacterium]
MSPREIETYADALAWLHGLKRFGVKPGLERMNWLMERLGHPERSLRFVHIAGTNGKGSTAAFLASVLQQAGYDVGLFTSPHLGSFANRIQVNGNDIPEQEVIRFVREVKPLAEELRASGLGAPTEFEIVTTISLLYFARVAYPYIVIWETGLGGSKDATNVVVPIASVITNIGYDHINVLGGSLAEIAREKAGIIKPGVPLITSDQCPEVMEVLRDASLRKKAALYGLGDQFRAVPLAVTPEKQTFRFEGPYRSYDDVEIALKGPHQVKNAAVALMTLEVLRQFYAFVIEEEDLRQGFAKAFWPGRFEIVAAEPTVILDGAHNPDGARALASALSSYYPGKKAHFILSVLEDKLVGEMVKELLPVASSFTATTFDFARVLSERELAERIRKAAGGRPVHAAKDWREAWRAVRESAQPGELIVVTGSLYFVAEVRQAWKKEKEAGDKGDI